MLREDDLIIRALTNQDLHPELLRFFNRYQRVSRVWRTINGEKVLKEEPQIEDWDEALKEEIVSQDFASCIEDGGTVFGAFLSNRLIAFSTLKNDFFGSQNQYVLLSQLHVSNEYRHYGLGKRLFELCVQAAKEWGAKKIYISGHSAEETQRFYERLGCIEAAEISKGIAEHHPNDYQLEYILSK